MVNRNYLFYRLYIYYLSQVNVFCHGVYFGKPLGGLIDPATDDDLVNYFLYALFIYPNLWEILTKQSLLGTEPKTI